MTESDDIYTQKAKEIMIHLFGKFNFNGHNCKALAAALKDVAEYTICDCHNWITDKEMHDYCVALEQKIKELEKEVEEQCRLNGMGAQREAALMAKVEKLQKELAKVWYEKEKSK